MYFSRASLPLLVVGEFSHLHFESESPLFLWRHGGKAAAIPSHFFCRMVSASNPSRRLSGPVWSLWEPPVSLSAFWREPMSDGLGVAAQPVVESARTNCGRMDF